MRWDEVVWRLEFWETFHREPNGWLVQPIYIPVIFSRPEIRIRLFSETARAHWRAAGEIVQIIGSSSGSDFEGGSERVPLNVTKLIFFPPGISNYSLKFLPKPWIESFEVRIESPEF